MPLTRSSIYNEEPLLEPLIPPRYQPFTVGDGTPMYVDEFILTVKTDNPGTSLSDQFTLSLNLGETYDFNYEFDGVQGTHNTDANLTLTAPSGSGTYQLIITSNTGDPLTGFPAVEFNNNDDVLKVISIDNWGSFRWQTFVNSFRGCSNMDILASDSPDMTDVTNIGNSFRDCSSMTFFPLLDYRGVTNRNNAWRGCSSLTSWDYLFFFDGASNMNHVWRNCTSLSSFPAFTMPPSVSSINNCWRNTNLTSFPSFDASNIVNANVAWRDCGVFTSFPELTLSSLTNGTNMLLNSTLDTTTWSNILINTEATNSNVGVPLHGGNSNYNVAGGVARDALILDHAWVITDGGPE